MKMKNLFTFLLTFIIIVKLNAQVSGNSVQQNYNQNSSRSLKDKFQIDKLFLNDSSFVIQANILKNVVADNYVAVFGVSETAKTLKESNENINKRIENFISELSKIGINKKDVYVDMTTQTKVYDFKNKDGVEEQYAKEFEIKKNVIIKFKNISELDKLFIYASTFDIYDLIKVDYNISNLEEIYNELFENAKNTIDKKKNLYVKATNVKLANSSQIYGEKFYNYTPSELYKSYTSKISSKYETDRYEKLKELAISPTYYFDNIDYSGFDKIINPIITEPVIQYVLSIQIKFQILK
jgi:uncharacterized protein YggE